MSFLNARKQDEAKLYYLLMLSDNECSEEEDNKFNAICTTLEISYREKKEIIDFCNQKMRGKIRNMNSFKRIIDEVLGTNDHRMFNSFSKKDEARIIWTMINLGYSDQEFSEIEKSIIQYMVKTWNFDEVIFADMMDTAETILALVEHKDWVMTTNKGYARISGSVKKIEQKMEELYKNIEINISEIEYA